MIVNVTLSGLADCFVTLAELKPIVVVVSLLRSFLADNNIFVGPRIVDNSGEIDFMLFPIGNVTSTALDHLFIGSLMG